MSDISEHGSFADRERWFINACAGDEDFFFRRVHVEYWFKIMNRSSRIQAFPADMFLDFATDGLNTPLNDVKACNLQDAERRYLRSCVG